MRICARSVNGWRHKVVIRNYYDAERCYPSTLLIVYANNIPWNRPRKKVIIENVLNRRVMT